MSAYDDIPQASAPNASSSAGNAYGDIPDAAGGGEAADDPISGLNPKQSLGDSYAALALAQGAAAKQEATPGTPLNIAASAETGLLVPGGEGALLARAGLGAAGGAISGALADPDHPIKGALKGAGVGAAGSAILGGLGRGGTYAINQWSKWAGPDSFINQRILNSSWAQAIGLPGATKLTPQLLDAADQKIGQVFDTIRDPNHIYHVDPDDVSGRIAAINSRWTPKTFGLANDDTVSRLLTDTKDGSINGEDLGAIESDLGRSAKAAAKAGDWQRASGLFQVQDHVRGLIAEDLSPAGQQAYNQARSQYRALTALTARSGNLDMSGDVNGAAVGRYLQRSDKKGYWYGRNQSPEYQATRLAHAAAGPNNLMDKVAQSSGGVAGAIGRAVVRAGPAARQFAAYAGGGPADALRSLVNRPGVLPALAAEAGDDDSTNTQ